MTPARKFWILAFIFGLLTAFCAALIFPYFPAEGHNLSAGYGGAVYAMEMARTPADLIAVFGPEGDPARAARIAAMDKGNLWDYAFMPAYAGFMALFAWAVYRETGNGMWKIIAAIGALSGIADAVENAILLGLTKDLAGAPFVQLLAFPVWIKFFAIGIAVAAAGLFMTRQSGRVQSKIWRIAGWAVMAASLAVPLSFIDASRFGYIAGSSIAIGWMAMLIFAGLRSVRKA